MLWLIGDYQGFTSSKALRFYIPPYSHKKINLAEINSSFSHVKIDCVFNGIAQLAWQMSKNIIFDDHILAILSWLIAEMS